MSTSQHARPAAVAAALVQAGLVDASREGEAERVVVGALGSGEPGTSSIGRRMSEIAGYVGGAFVVGAAALFFAHEWDSFGWSEQVALLAVTTAVLVGVGVVLGVTGGGFAALRQRGQSVRRRLSSVLFTGAAFSAAGALALPLARSHSSHLDDSAFLAAAAAGALVSLLGYLAAPTVVGLLGIATGLFLAVPGALELIGSSNATAMGLLELAVGVGWLLLTERNLFREIEPAQVIGCTVALIGAQIPIFGDDASLAYFATAALGLAAFGFYAGRPSWPYLATGVAAATLAVPEALTDWVGGSVGSAGVLLAAGVTLLVASLLGLRLRKEVA